MDERAHLNATGVIDFIGVPAASVGLNAEEDQDVSVKVVLSGLTLNIKVPRRFVYDEKGARRFNVDEYAKIDAILEEQSSVKSFENRETGRSNSYVQQTLRVKKVIAFEKVKG